MAVIGAGPIGIELAAALTRSKIDYVHFESGQIGSTMMRWPRNTVFFSSPEWIAIAGIPIQTVGQEQITGETYLAYLRQVVEVLGLTVRTYERVVKVERISARDAASADGAVTGNTPASTNDIPSEHVSRRSGTARFRLTTESVAGRRQFTVNRIALAIGDMSNPNLLGIPGENLPHVTHFFQDAHAYFRRKLLIVGGRNSAMEAALRCWRAGVDVTISYHGPEPPKNHILSRIFLEINILLEKGKIQFIPNSVPVEIRPGFTVLNDTTKNSTFEVPADFVFLATGFKPDQTLYEQIGVELVGAERIPRFNSHTMETNIPGVYIAGTTTGGMQSSYRVFITTSHTHTDRILRHAYGIDGAVTGNLPGRDYPLSPEDIE